MLQNSRAKLEEFLLAQEKVAIAFSGGMDSSFLAIFAQRIIPDKCIALLVKSVFMAESELNIARATAEKYHLNLREIPIDVLAEPLVCANSPMRCYYCKKRIFERLLVEADGATLCDGSVIDDAQDYRPGKKALAELGIKSPLLECGFTKEMVEKELNQLGADEVIRPAQSCLATRIATDVPLTPAKLKQIEKGEILLRQAGLEYFRLRHHGEVARIEVQPDSAHDALDRIASISEDLKKLGFKHVALDVDGYIKGSMNR